MTSELKEAENRSTVAKQESFIPLMRELVRAYQAFANYSDQHIRDLGLTPCQFDVLVSLGNTDGLLMQDLAEKTLVTKGTMTGIIDRLEAKGLVTRSVPADNRRSFIISLTELGRQIFEEVFPTHIEHLKKKFSKIDAQKSKQLELLLQDIKTLFETTSLT